ncbi:SUKH-3 domain-containing protein [Janthinobacterium lividum]|uniref:SUKH-3 domain-containing protein n=1 Tax=Janthinobacterium lividum TaxID=29581 RepID=UPI00140AE5AD|nr:SUKH-3 domain-containing protein [Janthinobacterium lividum]NHQ92375.1 hypothetical protein [Janthinobacterium lividum]
MFALSEKIRPIFEQAGWVPHDRYCGPQKSPRQVALAILSDFGGLNVGSTGAGIEMAKGDISFFNGLKPEANAVLRRWRNQTGDVEAVANAHHDHIIVFVGVHGFYAFTDPDDQLYHLGPDFSVAMEKLLLGVSLGKPLAGY